MLKNTPKLPNATHDFSKVPASTAIPRSTFYRPFGRKQTFNSGQLVPMFTEEVLPGDSHFLQMSAVVRLTTPKFPIMDNLTATFFYFFVPNRLLWDNWEKFQGSRDNPDDSIDFRTPLITCPQGGWAKNTLSDYFGFPTGVGGLDAISFYHRAYNLIYNEWFRDENLQDSLDVPTGDGPDNDGDFVIKNRGKRHDYFTSCLPTPQKGAGVPLIPAGQYKAQAPIRGLTYTSYSTPTHLSGFDQWGTTGVISANPETNGHYYFDEKGQAIPVADLTGEISLSLHGDKNNPITYPYADLGSLATYNALTINDFRQAFQIQMILEADNRGGTRYVEILQSHFGVTSPDFRLQRPEYLGGGKVPVQFSTVPQTSSTDSVSPQGNVSAFSVTEVHGNGFKKSFVEHGVILGMVSVNADLSYQQGLPRAFSRRTRFDYYMPLLAHLGEQAVLNKEIFAQGTSDDDKVFGYQERWSEYRFRQNEICGDFRSNATQSLDSWHLAEEFSSLPKLSSKFITSNPPVDRILAVQSQPQFLMDCYFALTSVRILPTYGVPGLINRF